MVSEQAPFSRDELVLYLEESGVETRPEVAGNLARQPATKKLAGMVIDDLPGADNVHEGGFYLGIHPLEEMQIEFERVWDLIDRFVSERG